MALKVERAVGTLGEARGNSNVLNKSVAPIIASPFPRSSAEEKTLARARDLKMLRFILLLATVQAWVLPRTTLRQGTSLSGSIAPKGERFVQSSETPDCDVGLSRPTKII